MLGCHHIFLFEFPHSFFPLGLIAKHWVHDVDVFYLNAIWAYSFDAHVSDYANTCLNAPIVLYGCFASDHASHPKHYKKLSFLTTCRSLPFNSSKLMLSCETASHNCCDMNVGRITDSFLNWSSVYTP